MRARARTIRVVAMFLVAGAIVNLLIAAACALWSPTRDGVLTYDQGFESAEATRIWAEWKKLLPVAVDRSYFRTDETYVYQGWGVRLIELAITYTWLIDSWGGSNQACKIVLLAGWPAKSLRADIVVNSGEVTLPAEATKSSPALTGLDALHPALLLSPPKPRSFFIAQVSAMKRPLPLGVVWPGFVYGSLFWAAALALALLVPRLIRRYRRLLRAQCPACAYPQGPSPVCTECGERLPPRATAVSLLGGQTSPSVLERTVIHSPRVVRGLPEQ